MVEQEEHSDYTHTDLDSYGSEPTVQTTSAPLPFERYLLNMELEKLLVLEAMKEL